VEFPDDIRVEATLAGNPAEAAGAVEGCQDYRDLGENSRVVPGSQTRAASWN
jgi:hypothetical protein